jgi:uncharacterized RDD family membrane protein YckC
MVYETLIVGALLIVSALVFARAVDVLTAVGVMSATEGWRLRGWARHAFQLFLCAVMGLYFCWFWHRGQTLAMRTWRLRLVGTQDKPPSWLRAFARYLAALALLGPSLESLLWLREHPDSLLGWAALVPGVGALAYTRFNDARSTLYDRIASTRLVLLAPQRRKRKPVSVSPPTTS